MAKIEHAKDCKCYVCGKQAVAFYPVIDPDIPSTPYCADCLYKAMLGVAKAVWPDDKGMQVIAEHEAKKILKKFKANERPDKEPTGTT